MNPLTPLELLDILEQKHNFESPALREALTELEELKNNKIIIDKEDTERYLSMFERQVLKQIVKEIEDKKKLYSLDRQLEELK